MKPKRTEMTEVNGKITIKHDERKRPRKRAFNKQYLNKLKERL
jgi:hypothetical protein